MVNGFTPALQSSDDDRIRVELGTVLLALRRLRADLASGRVQRTLIGHGKSNIWSLRFAPDSRRLLSAGDNDLVIVWDVESEKPLVTLTDTDVDVTSLDWSPDGKRIVAGKFDGTIQLWELPKPP